MECKSCSESEFENLISRISFVLGAVHNCQHVTMCTNHTILGKGVNAKKTVNSIHFQHFNQIVIIFIAQYSFANVDMYTF